MGSYLEALDQLKGGKKMQRMIIQFGVSTEEGSRFLCQLDCVTRVTECASSLFTGVHIKRDDVREN